MSTSRSNQIHEVRKFNRFYTRIIGALREGLLQSRFSLTEARIIFEIAQNTEITASILCKDLGLDAGYLSRILNKFEQERLVTKSKSAKDKRQHILKLTEKGKQDFKVLNERSTEEIDEMLSNLILNDQYRLIQAMQAIQEVLTQSFKYSEPFILRTHTSGDMGWVVQQHGALYFQEYNWNQEFELLVLQIVTNFLQNFDPPYERCWIAEMSGKKVGSVFIVKESEHVAKLRLLLVNPEARGYGVGTRLVEECITFSRACGYSKIVLWTNSVLIEARKIYEIKGFILTKEEPHHSFGKDLIGQYWELTL